MYIGSSDVETSINCKSNKSNLFHYIMISFFLFYFVIIINKIELKIIIESKMISFPKLFQYFIVRDCNY